VTALVTEKQFCPFLEAFPLNSASSSSSSHTKLVRSPNIPIFSSPLGMRCNICRTIQQSGDRQYLVGSGESDFSQGIGSSWINTETLEEKSRASYHRPLLISRGIEQYALAKMTTVDEETFAVMMGVSSLN
jgi:hypothetical protein